MPQNRQSEPYQSDTCIPCNGWVLQSLVNVDTEGGFLMMPQKPTTLPQYTTIVHNRAAPCLPQRERLATKDGSFHSLHTGCGGQSTAYVFPDTEREQKSLVVVESATPGTIPSCFFFLFLVKQNRMFDRQSALSSSRSHRRDGGGAVWCGCCRMQSHCCLGI